MPARSSLTRFVVLYGALFAAFGVASPFLPSLLMQDGLEPTQIGAILAAGTAIRLVSGPSGGQLADRLNRAPAVFAGFAAASALVATGYVSARGMALLLLVAVGHAAVLAPLTPIADALALGSARSKPGFDYGWVRAAGSAAFVAGTLLAGQWVELSGLSVIVWLNASLLLVAACLGWFAPNVVAGSSREDGASGGFAAILALLAIPVFRRLMLVAALIGGSHALHDGFEVIRWRSAGLSDAQSSLLWSLSVVSEVVIFLLVGRKLLDRLGPGRALALSATAGVLRWGAAAQTARFSVMALVEPLHGLTFALMHLACMDMISRVVPAKHAATAQAFYATVAVGAAEAAVTLASGRLYDRLGAASFWVMAAMCVVAIPLGLSIRAGVSVPTSKLTRAC